MQTLDAWICFNSFFSSLFNLSKYFFFTFIVFFVRPKHNESIIMIDYNHLILLTQIPSYVMELDASILVWTFIYNHICMNNKRRLG